MRTFDGCHGHWLFGAFFLAVKIGKAALLVGDYIPCCTEDMPLKVTLDSVFRSKVQVNM